jgi:hypothetical protein
MKIDDGSLVPIRWVFVSLGLSCGALASVVIGALSVGAWTTKVSLGQEAQSARIASVETKVESNSEKERLLEKELIDRLARIETKIDRMK